MLLGDSHLARVRRDLDLLGADVLNAARGGASALDLAAQAAGVGLADDDTLVVSVGTNDAAPWKQVPLDDFRSALGGFLRAAQPRRRVYVAPPGVDEARLGREVDRSNAVVDAYRRAALEVAVELGAAVVRADLVLGGLGPDAFTDDGVHLTGAAYRMLLPAVAAAVTEAP